MTAKSFNRKSSFISYRSRAILSDLAEEIFVQEGSYKRLGIKREKLSRFIKEIGRNYRRNYYHNLNHAVDTLNTTAWMISTPTIRQQQNDFERFLLLVSAFTHDVDHPGNDNNWERKTNSEWAQNCKTNSIIETHSIEITKEMLEAESTNILSALPDGDQERFLKDFKDLVLWTDFALHNDFVSLFDQNMKKNGKNFSEAGYSKIVNTALLKGADIGNLTKPFSVAKRWGYRVMQENWAQGEREKAANLPVGPLNDQATVEFHRAQADFIDKAAMNFFKMLASIASEMEELVFDLEVNRNAYEISINKQLKSVK